MCRFQASLIVQEPDSFPDSMFLDFTSGSAGKESTCNAGDLGSIPEFGRSPGGGKGYPPQYSGLENSMDCIVHGVAKSWAQLRDLSLYVDFFLIFLLCVCVCVCVCIVYRSFWGFAF